MVRGEGAEVFVVSFVGTVGAECVAANRRAPREAFTRRGEEIVGDAERCVCCERDALLWQIHWQVRGGVHSLRSVPSAFQMHASRSVPLFLLCSYAENSGSATAAYLQDASDLRGPARRQPRSSEGS